ncbi:hypothetical protein RND71_014707 [Anisodus tanguticus]|uniref:Uncharacterized protein n=1 Tax=Anisodus tanguticus TaxID=243964 RepID=A0AAE1SC80_9SOLA|nr:hypothetical protein RND71_014707 [Anisodus tanguticus]
MEDNKQTIRLSQVKKTKEAYMWENIEKLNGKEVIECETWLKATILKMKERLKELESEASSSRLLHSVTKGGDYTTPSNLWWGTLQVSLDESHVIEIVIVNCSVNDNKSTIRLSQVKKTKEAYMWENIEKLNAKEVIECETWLKATILKMKERLKELESEATKEVLMRLSKNVNRSSNEYQNKKSKRYRSYSIGDSLMALYESTTLILLIMFLIQSEDRVCRYTVHDSFNNSQGGQNITRGLFRIRVLIWNYEDILFLEVLGCFFAKSKKNFACNCLCVEQRATNLQEMAFLFHKALNQTKYIKYAIYMSIRVSRYPYCYTYSQNRKQTQDSQTRAPMDNKQTIRLSQVKKTREAYMWENIEKLNAKDVIECETWLKATILTMKERLKELESEATKWAVKPVIYTVYTYHVYHGLMAILATEGRYFLE